MAQRNNNDDLNAPSNIQRVNSLEDKIERCYSADRYEDFQDAVEKVASRWFKGTYGWAILLWVATIILSMVAEKFGHIF